MTSVWDGIVGAGPLGATKQKELSDPKYTHIKELLQAMPMPESTAAKDAGEKLQDGLTNKIFGQAVGINDKVAIPLNAALATPEARAFVVKLAHDHPEDLGNAVDAIVANPGNTALIMKQAQAKYGQQEAAASPSAPPAPAKEDKQHITTTTPVTTHTDTPAPTAQKHHTQDADVLAFQKAVLLQAKLENNPALAAQLGKSQDDGLLGVHTLTSLKDHGIDTSKIKFDAAGIATKESLEAFMKEQKPALEKFENEMASKQTPSVQPTKLPDSTPDQYPPVKQTTQSNSPEVTAEQIKALAPQGMDLSSIKPASAVKVMEETLVAASKLGVSEDVMKQAASLIYDIATKYPGSADAMLADSKAHKIEGLTPDGAQRIMETSLKMIKADMGNAGVVATQGNVSSAPTNSISNAMRMLDTMLTH